MKPTPTITQVDFYRTLRQRQEFFERVMRFVRPPTFFQRHSWLKRKSESRNACPTIAAHQPRDMVAK